MHSSKKSTAQTQLFGIALTARLRTYMSTVAKPNKTFRIAYLLKEQFRLASHLGRKEAIAALDDWFSWSKKSRSSEFVNIFKSIVEHRESIVTTPTYYPFNALIESSNITLHLITRMVFRFKSTENLIPLCLLNRRGRFPRLSRMRVA
jgi:transposase